MAGISARLYYTRLDYTIDYSAHIVVHVVAVVVAVFVLPRNEKEVLAASGASVACQPVFCCMSQPIQRLETLLATRRTFLRYQPKPGLC